MKNATEINTGQKTLLPIFIGAILLFCAAIFIIDYFGNRTERYIMPLGFTGKLTIIYGQADGVAEKKEEQHRVFEIPRSGILKTQSTYKDQWYTYYYRMEDGQLIPLSQGDARNARGMPLNVYSGSDTIFVQDIHRKKQDINGKKVDVITYTVEKSL